MQAQQHLYDFRPALSGVLPGSIREALTRLPAATLQRICEIRFGVRRAARVVYSDATDSLLRDGHNRTITLDDKQCDLFLLRITEYSGYAFEEQIKNGYITLKGGYRVGLCGRAQVAQGAVQAITQCNGFNIRIPRDIHGCADELARKLQHMGYIPNILIVSAPGLGKTTLVRDLARSLSQGKAGRPRRVCIVDERGEISGGGEAPYDLGDRTDVLCDIPKAQGMMHALRSLSPEVVITDEIGTAVDMQAILQLSLCGVSVIATAHGRSYEDVRRRFYAQGIDGYFDLCALIDGRRGPGVISSCTPIQPAGMQVQA